MPYVTLVNPLIDILLFSLAFNVCSYAAYAYIYKQEFAKIASVDIKLSLVEILLVVLNYGWRGVTISLPFFGDTWWWVWYMIVSIPMGFLFLFIYKYLFGLGWSEMLGSAREET